MRIGIDCRLIDKVHNTGISRYTFFLLRYYIERFNTNELFLITNDRAFIYRDCCIVYTDLKPYNLADFIAFPSFIKKQKLHALHSPFYSGLCRKVSGMLSIVTVHDLMFKIVDGFFGNNFIINFLKKYHFNFIVKRTVSNADLIIAISETTQKDIHDHYKLESVHIPEDSGIDHLADFDIIKSHNLKNKGFFLYCGNGRRHKNLKFIINLFNNNEALPPLILAGKGHSSSKNVIAVGVVSDGALKALYASAIAFIFPSKYEGFGLPILEALRSNTLVIASKIPAFTEFKSKNIAYFELQNEKMLLNVIEQSLSKTFIDEPGFFSKFDKENIYKVNDESFFHLLRNIYTTDYGNPN